jgi:hypothetical protein
MPYGEPLMQILFLLLCCFSVSVTAEQKTEEIIKKSLKVFYEKMASNDEDVRKKAIIGILPDEETFKLFLTKEEIELVIKPMKMMSARYLTMTDKLKEEMTRSGKVTSIRLTSIKERHKNSKFLERIKFPAYSASIKYERGSSGSSTYFLQNGQLKWIRGLEDFDRALEQFKKISEKLTK